MKDLAIATFLALSPFIGLVLMSYLMGRADGRRAEQLRRAHAADGLLAKKERPECIRL